MKHLFGALLTLPVFGFTALAQAPEYTAHEWGTFTSLYGSEGRQLSEIYREEEQLPGFVYKLDGVANEGILRVIEHTEGGTYHARTRLKDVTVKMETPVIYFYSDQAFSARVKVDFTEGLIGQWYPECTKKPVVSYGASASTENGIVLGDRETVDFGKAQNSAVWDIRVNAPGEISEDVIRKAGETTTWTAPRETDANIISYGKEHEKYIFYRGLGSFEMPLKVGFDITGILQIENSGIDEIPYVFVYERKDDGKALVYWTGALDPNEKQGVHVDVSTEGSFSDKIAEFQKALVNAGLYDKEASAMLKTWEQSYFNHSGLRVFWIAPRALTDEIIPISISPAPKNLERVLVGRSEILKPSFEKQLTEKNSVLNSLANDRFYLAMRQRVNYLKSNREARDAVADKVKNQAISNAEYEKMLKTEEIKIYHESSDQECIIMIDRPQNDQAAIVLSDMIGHPLMELPLNNLSSTENYSQRLDISRLPLGMYLVRVETPSQKYYSKIVRR